MFSCWGLEWRQLLILYAGYSKYEDGFLGWKFHTFGVYKEAAGSRLFMLIFNKQMWEFVF